MKALATVLGIGVGVGWAFGMIVVSPGPEAPLLGGLLAFISVLYVADLADMRHR